MLPSTLSLAVGEPTPEDTGHQPSFAALVPGVRCGILVLAAFVAAVRGPLTHSVIAWGALLVAHAAWRARRRSTAENAPARPDSASVPPGALPSMALAAEVFLTVLAVDSTGYWGSPFAFCLLGVVAVAGLGVGFRLAAQVAGVIVLSVALPAHLQISDFSAAGLGISGQWAIELLLVAILAGYARRLFGEAEERHSLALDRVSQLAEANDLLVSLHRVAQTLPASLDLDQVATSTVERFRTLIDCDVSVLLLRHEVTGRWVVAAVEGAAAGRSLTDESLPVPFGRPPPAASPPSW